MSLKRGQLILIEPWTRKRLGVEVVRGRAYLLKLDSLRQVAGGNFDDN